MHYLALPLISLELEPGLDENTPTKPRTRRLEPGGIAAKVACYAAKRASIATGKFLFKMSSL